MTHCARGRWPNHRRHPEPTAGHVKARRPGWLRCTRHPARRRGRLATAVTKGEFPGVAGAEQWLVLGERLDAVIPVLADSSWFKPSIAVAVTNDVAIGGESSSRYSSPDGSSGCANVTSGSAGSVEAFLPGVPGIGPSNGVAEPAPLPGRHQGPSVVEIEGVLRAVLLGFEQQDHLRVLVAHAAAGDPRHLVEVGDEARVAFGLPSPVRRRVQQAIDPPRRAG